MPRRSGSPIDAAEVFSPKCQSERIAGYKAALRINDLVAGPRSSSDSGSANVNVTIAREGQDVYGRTLARIALADGRDLGQVLIAEGYARPWAGHRENWCE